ncbi:50S ribosomal protein L21 [Candidatus Peregrinibacteria bacterium]|nr:50S ribosomal protein L21 [Candidatus Peregrinibacteria bacterium]
MFAVVEIGGSQYKVSPKDVIEVQKIDGAEGDKITLNTVVLLANSDTEAKIGQPYVDGATVEAKILGELKGEKIHIFKMKPKKRFSKKQGHRQNYTKLEIIDVKA